ncbi:MAG: hypothetical protein WCH77_11090 [Planctomycetota bacterium]
MLVQGTKDSFRCPSAGLPLTAFEEHMLLDDRPSHPMVIVARFDFVDDAPPATLAEAFHTTLLQEPLLTARVNRGRMGRPRWLPGAIPQLKESRVEHGLAGNAQWTGPLPRLDPESGRVIHAEAIQHSAGWSILLAVHHAACDGLGLVGFVERWLLAADGKSARRPRQVSDVMAALASRGRVAASWNQFIRMLPGLAKGLEGVGQFVSRDVIRIDPLRAELPTVGGGTARGGADTWLPCIHSATLQADEVHALDQLAKAERVMVNDLLVAALMAAIGDHADACAAVVDPKAWIRIGIPMSLRTKSDFALPAANRVSMIFLDRLPGDRHDRGQLIRSVRDEMELIRSHALGHIFPLSLEAGRLLPGGLRRTPDSPKPQCTAVLSNLGRCFQRSPLADEQGCIRIGHGRLADWWIVPPIRPGTALAVATHETAGRRTVTFQFDSERICAAAAVAWPARMLDQVGIFSATATAGTLQQEQAGAS